MQTAGGNGWVRRLSARARRRRPGRLGAVLLAAISALFSLALLIGASELWLRARPRTPEQRAMLDEGAAYGKLLLPAHTPRLAQLGWIALRPDAAVRVGAVRRETNHLGFRDLPHPGRKAPGVFRLVVIGDSYVYGQGIAEVSGIFARRLGVDRIGERPLEVVLMGYCGADLLVYNAMFQDLALPLEPDAVLVSLVSNDLEDRTQAPEPCLPRAARILLRATPLVRAEAEERCNRLTRDYERQLERQFDRASASYRRERAALAEMKAVADSRGIDLLAFFFHSRADALGMDGVYGELTGSLGIPYASLVPEIARLLRDGAAQETFDVSRVDGHPNERAHGLAAAVATGLLRRRYAAEVPADTPGGDSGARAGP